VMADAELQVLQLFRGREVMAQILRDDGLAGAADIVALSLDGHQRGAGDRARIDPVAMYLEAAMRQILALKYPFKGLQVELGRQIHHGAVFVVKRARRRRAVIVALDQLLEHSPMRRDMAVEVHAEKAGELQ